MTRLGKYFLAIGMITLISGAVHASDFAHDGKVDIFAALAVAETTELDFGAVTDTDGIVTLDLVGGITDPSSIHVGGTVASGVYTISGQASQNVSVSFAGSSASGLAIGNFTTSESDLANVLLDGTGNLAMTVGADLTVTAASAATGADQSLNFTISVTYN